MAASKDNIETQLSEIINNNPFLAEICKNEFLSNMASEVKHVIVRYVIEYEHDPIETFLRFLTIGCLNKYIIKYEMINQSLIYELFDHPIHNICDKELLFLEHLALINYIENKNNIDIVTINNIIEADVPTENLIRLEIVNIENNKISFIHNSLQNYFLAMFLGKCLYAESEEYRPNKRAIFINNPDCKSDKKYIESCAPEDIKKSRGHEYIISTAIKRCFNNSINNINKILKVDVLTSIGEFIFDNLDKDKNQDKTLHILKIMLDKESKNLSKKIFQAHIKPARSLTPA